MDRSRAAYQLFKVILFWDVVLTLLNSAIGSELALDIFERAVVGMSPPPRRFSQRREPIIMLTDRREHPSDATDQADPRNSRAPPTNSVR